MSSTTPPPAPAHGSADVTQEKLAEFDLVETHYKHVKGHPIGVAILIPKSIKPSSKQPVIIRWHGGGLITGHSLFAPWFSPWILDLALSKNAILVMPEYRLLPEAKGLDILQDSIDFYTWLQQPSSLARHIPSSVTPDLDDLLVIGESAGGWFALQAAFLPSNLRHNVGALISMFPMIDMRDPHYTQAYHKDLFAPPAPQLDASVWRAHVESLKGDEVISAAMPPARLPLVLSVLQQGLYAELLGDDARMYPLEMLASPETTTFPPLWIMHGLDDNVVPAEGTRKFVSALQAKFPQTRVHASYRPGMHGFDVEEQNVVEDAWLKEGLAFVDKVWPKTA